MCAPGRAGVGGAGRRPRRQAAPAALKIAAPASSSACAVPSRRSSASDLGRHPLWGAGADFDPAGVVLADTGAQLRKRAAGDLLARADVVGGPYAVWAGNRVNAAPERSKPDQLVRLARTAWLSTPRLPRSTCDSHDSDRPARAACDRPRLRRARAICWPVVSGPAPVTACAPGTAARRLSQPTTASGARTEHQGCRAPAHPSLAAL